ncbi:MAG: energy transducer TonB [Gemmatimonadales bacterium]
MTRIFSCLALAVFSVGCSRKPPAQEPVTPAVPIAGQPEIPYPSELFNRRIQGEVMLYVVVDTTGTVIRDSTRIATSSGQAAFDAAALTAAQSLRFTPAQQSGKPVVAPIQVPIRFTLPDSLLSPKDSS